MHTNYGQWNISEDRQIKIKRTITLEHKKVFQSGKEIKRISAQNHFRTIHDKKVFIKIIE